MSLIIMSLAAMGMVALASSAALALVLYVLRAPVDRLAPAAQARLFLFAALLPLVAGASVLAAALAPSFGWIADHYGGELHSHPHLCAAHPMADWPTIPLTLLALFVSCRLAFITVRKLRALQLGMRTRRALDEASVIGGDGSRVLPIDEAQAFVLGLLRPTLYITRGLKSEPARKHLPAVVAHEEAHRKRFDPLRRFVASIGLSLHLPGVARWLHQKHEQAQEMAADDMAAEQLASREAVASALVALAKSRFAPPQSAFAAASSCVEKRVLQLMEERRRNDWPKRSLLLLCGSAGLFVIAAAAGTIHHKVEFLLGAIGS